MKTVRGRTHSSSNRPNFTRGMGDTRIDMLRNNISVADLRQSIIDQYGWSISMPQLSAVIDDKLVDFVKKEVSRLSLKEEGKVNN
tara:strand:- start:698 stop:952 length:255 start_codon:yes stop_codon:yes gene_type:complete